MWHFGSDFLHWALCFWDSSMLQHVSVLHAFLWLNNVNRSHFSSSTHQLMDVWVSFTFWLLWIMLLARKRREWSLAKTAGVQLSSGRNPVYRQWHKQHLQLGAETLTASGHILVGMIKGLKTEDKREKKRSLAVAEENLWVSRSLRRNGGSKGGIPILRARDQHRIGVKVQTLEANRQGLESWLSFTSHGTLGQSFHLFRFQFVSHIQGS